MIQNLVAKYPQLQTGNSKLVDFYSLVRAIKNGPKGFQLQLLTTPDSIKDTQKIIVFTNSKGQHYAIPFFSNTYRDYWDFQFDTPIPAVMRVNTTFEKELVKALDVLKLDDTLGTGKVIVDEMLFSLLHCVPLNEGDSIQLHTLFITNNFDLPAESSDSSFLRLKKNYKAISKEWHPKKYIYNYNSYFDNENHRVYQLSYKQERVNQKPGLSVKVYRQDFISPQFTM